ncbi:hypothetical protein COOONC_00776 [Cooperia oncophora]
MEVVDSIVVHPMNDQYDDEEEKQEKKPKKHDFAPISGDEFLRRDDTSQYDDKEENESEDADVKPLEVNEEKLDEDEEDSGELLKDSDGRVNIVAIAIRNKEKSQTEDDDEPDSSYALNCHFIGVLLYMVCFVLLLGAVLKRCFKSNTHIPVMNFSDEQCASEISKTFFTNKLLLNSSTSY